MNHHNLRDPQWGGWSILFGLTAVWTLSGAIPGFFFPEWAYQSFNGRASESPEVLELFRGSWGQTLLFGLGYAFAALNPMRHGVVAFLGATGKVMFAARLALSSGSGELSGMSLVALVGDLIFAALIFWYVLGTGQFLSYFRRASVS